MIRPKVKAVNKIYRYRSNRKIRNNQHRGKCSLPENKIARRNSKVKKLTKANKRKLKR